MYKVILTSKNPAKLAALERALSKHFDKFEIVQLEFDSGVSKMPFSDDEAIRGCNNRITFALKTTFSADLIFALEGLISTNIAGTFIYGWSVVYSVIDKKVGYGCSAKVRIPDFIAKQVSPSKNIHHLMTKYYDPTLVSKIKDIGINGVITNGVYTRVDEFEGSINCALGYLYNFKNYEVDQL